MGEPGTWENGEAVCQTGRGAKEKGQWSAYFEKGCQKIEWPRHACLPSTGARQHGGRCL